MLPEVAQLRRGRAGMQTQVCWTPNPVFFPLPLEEELGGAPSAHTSHPLPLHIPCGTVGQAGT